MERRARHNKGKYNRKLNSLNSQRATNLKQALSGVLSVSSLFRWDLQRNPSPNCADSHAVCIPQREKQRLSLRKQVLAMI